MSPIRQKLAYINGICRNRFNYWDPKKGAIILQNYVKAFENQGYSESQIIEDLENEVIKLSKESKHWSEWRGTLERWTTEIKNWKNEDNFEISKIDENFDERLRNACRNLADNTIGEQNEELIDHEKQEENIQKIFELAKLEIKLSLTPDDDPEFVIHAVNYLGYSHALDLMENITDRFVDLLRCLIKFCCTITPDTPESTKIFEIIKRNWRL